MSGQLDAPNKQVLGLDPPWVEGTGGAAGAEPKPSQQQERRDDEPRTGTTHQPVPDSGTGESEPPAPQRRRKGGDEG